MTPRLERARRLMDRPGAWLDSAKGGYALRLGPDRRARTVMTLEESEFRALAEAPGLKVRAGGGWMRRNAPERVSPGGRPGVVEAEREVDGPDGVRRRVRVNVATTAVAWLAARKDRDGRPMLDPAEVAAGERLTADGELARRGASLTMRWDALPRRGAGGGADHGPGGAALAARRRVAAALSAARPLEAQMLARVCLEGDALRAAEGRLGLAPRRGRELLKAGLRALARHYGIG
ncbi:MAG: DUF6456 domain-containing protein [Brevundimonas sp.]